LARIDSYTLTLQPAPEPSTFALLAAGLLGLAAWLPLSRAYRPGLRRELRDGRGT
jgi:hypothetical protein